MRITSLVILWLICSISGLGQDKEKSISFLFNNNGILNDLIDQYATRFNVHMPFFTTEFKESRFKFDLLGELQLKENLNFTAKLGFGRISSRGIDTSGRGAETKSKQNIANVSIGFLYRVEFGKLRLATGFDIPFYFVGNYTLDSDYRDPGNEYVYKLDINGGFVTGLTNSTSLRYMIGAKTYIITTVTFGLVYSHFGGGPSLFSMDYLNPNREDNINHDDRGTAKTLSISKPDLSFGAGLKF